MGLLNSFRYVREKTRKLASEWMAGGVTLIQGSLTFAAPVTPAIPQRFLASDTTGPTYDVIREALDVSMPSADPQAGVPLSQWLDKLDNSIFKVTATGDPLCEAIPGADRMANFTVQTNMVAGDCSFRAEHTLTAANRIKVYASDVAVGIQAYDGSGVGIIGIELYLAGGSPEGVEDRPLGWLIQSADGNTYLKTTASGASTGWLPLSTLVPPLNDNTPLLYHNGAPTSTAKFLIGATGPYTFTFQSQSGTVSLDGVLSGSAKGKIVVGNGSNTTAQSGAPGGNDQPLIADSAQATGVAWGFNVATGSGTCSLGTNSPGTGTPTEWIRIRTAAGNVRYIPCWA